MLILNFQACVYLREVESLKNKINVKMHNYLILYRLIYVYG